MRVGTLCAVFCILCSVSSAQWLETTIQLPDSSGPVAVCYSPPANKVYCANALDSSLTVISGLTNGIIDTIHLGFRPGSLFAPPAAAKAYCSDGAGRIAVLNVLTDSVVAVLAETAGAFCLNPATNKLYGVRSTGLLVLDGAADTVIARLALPSTPRAVCCNPATNRLYSVDLFLHQVTVIDGAADTVRRTVRTGWYPNDGCLDTVLNRLFVSCEYPGQESTLVTIDCAAESVISRVRMPHGPTGLCYNQPAQKVYVANYYGGTVTAYSGATGQYIASRYVGPGVGTTYYNSVSNKVYCFISLGNRIAVLHGTTHQLVASVLTDSYPGVEFAWNPVANRTYALYYRYNRIAVIGDELSGQEEPASPEATPTTAATIVRGALSLQSAIFNLKSAIVLVDVSGRKVADLHPGANDVRRLAPGVYFINEQSAVSSQHSGLSAVGGERSAVAVRKVIVTR